MPARESTQDIAETISEGLNAIFAVLLSLRERKPERDLLLSAASSLEDLHAASSVLEKGLAEGWLQSDVRLGDADRADIRRLEELFRDLATNPEAPLSEEIEETAGRVLAVLGCRSVDDVLRTAPAEMTEGFAES